MSEKSTILTVPTKSPALLVSGSAGYVGRYFTRQLAEQGRAAISLYRAHLPEPMAHAVPVFGDLLRKEHICSALRGVDTVVHLAWNQSFRSRIEEALRGSEDSTPFSRNLEVVENLIQSMEESGTQRIIFLSALGVSRFADSLYLKEKYQAEAMFLNSRIPEKIILRSSLAFCELSYRDRLVSAIENLMRFPWFYPIPKTKEKLAPIHVRDLCRILCHLTDQKLAEAAQILEVTGQQELSLEELFRLVSQGIGKGKQIPLKGLLGDVLTPFFERIYQNPRPMGPHLRELLTLNNRPDFATTINNSLLSTLKPMDSTSFQEAMRVQH